MDKVKKGSIIWQDLTVKNAEEVAGFYEKVVGWKISSQSMGNYDDYNMHCPEDEDIVSGICHARGDNAKIPAQWLMYVTVDNIDEAVKNCLELGGKVIDGPRKMGDSDFCVIQDPAGAFLGLISPIEDTEE